jgi:predicted SAM-dependent methyltransferase
MYAQREDILKSMQISPQDFVVEIGSGHNPFHATDLIIDKYPFDNVHRTGDMVYTAPVVKADAIKLPLPIKGCDVLFASHILEHLCKPDKFIEEVKRCSRRVYLEFPSMVRELMYAWSFHEWLIEAEDRHLVFYRNDIPQLFGTFFHRNHDALFNIWSLQRFGTLNSHVYCSSDELTYEFAEETAFEHILASCPMGAAKVNWATITPVRYSWSGLAKLAAQRMVHEGVMHWAAEARRRWRKGINKPFSQALVDRLACQKCRAGGLELRVTEIACHACGALYGQQNGVFDFDI